MQRVRWVVRGRKGEASVADTCQWFFSRILKQIVLIFYTKIGEIIT